ncbi:MAG TPA: hypothetical protein VGM82_22515 [Gemmatimonadaceae bacterium]|jgi:hypothetical protein
MKQFTIAVFCFAGAFAPPATAQRSVVSATPGFTYTLTVSGDSPSMPQGVTGGAGSQGYIAKAAVLGARGRMDIVEGGIPELFAKGDYLLFDSTEVVVVHPSAQQFVLLTQQAMNAGGQLDTTAFSMKMSDEKVLLDSIGPGDTISTFPTTRYRLTIAFNMELSVASMAMRVGSEAITDYWVATIPGMAPNPLLRSNGMNTGKAGVPGMMHAFSLRVDSASSRMGRTIVLRSTSKTRINPGAGRATASHTGAVVSDVRRAPVDKNSLIVPIQYNVLPLPGLPADSLGDGAKWKVPPPGE